MIKINLLISFVLLALVPAQISAQQNGNGMSISLTQPLTMRSIGALSSPEGKTLSISKNFDMIVYFDKTSSI